MTSRDARRDPIGPDARPTGSPSGLGQVALEELNAALYALRVQPGADQAQTRALTSIAASLLRIAGTPGAPRGTDRRLEAVEANLRALANAVWPRLERVEGIVDGELVVHPEDREEEPGG